MPLPEPYPDLAALDLLVTVGELGSISAAAAAHGITQPAASMRLQSLERLLKVPLLERSPRGTGLTSAGTATVEWAAAVLGGMRTLLAGTSALRADGASSLRLGASLTVAEYLVPRWLHQLGATMPQVRVALEMGNTAHIADLVGREEVDLGFIEGARPPGRLRSTELLRDELVIVVPRTHPWTRRRRQLSARELAATPLVLREQGSGTREVLADALAAVGLEPRAAMELGSTTAIKAATISGAGPTVLSALAVEAEVREGQLVVVRCDDLPLRRTLRAIWHPTRGLAASARSLLSIASSGTGRLPASAGGARLG